MSVFGTDTSENFAKADGYDFLQTHNFESEALYITYLIDCSDWEYIYTYDILEIMERYALHKQGIFSFGNIYDDLPSWWVECLMIMKAEERKAQEAWARSHGNK